MLLTNLNRIFISFGKKALHCWPGLGTNLVIVGCFVVIVTVCQNSGTPIDSPFDKARSLTLIDPQPLIALFVGTIIAYQSFLFIGRTSKLRSHKKRGQEFAKRVLQDLNSSLASAGSLAFILFLITGFENMILLSVFAFAWLLAIVAAPMPKQEKYYIFCVD